MMFQKKKITRSVGAIRLGKACITCHNGETECFGNRVVNHSQQCNIAGHMEQAFIAVLPLIRDGEALLIVSEARPYLGRLQAELGCIIDVLLPMLLLSIQPLLHPCGNRVR